MARIGIWIPFETVEGAKGGLAKVITTGLSGDIIRLKYPSGDRTGPSVAARFAALEDLVAANRAAATASCNTLADDLAALEAVIGEPVCVGCRGTVGHHHAPDQGGCSGWFPTVREHLARVETEHRTVVERLDSHRERLAAVEDFATELRNAENTMTHRIGNLESDILDHRTRLGDLEREPAPVRPEPGGAVDPDRLAKVAHRAETERYLDQPYTDANFAALLPNGRDRLRRVAAAVAEANGLQNDVLAKAVDDLTAERVALLARAEKAERELAKWVQEACDVGEALKPYRAPPTAAFLSRADDIRDLVADWQKRCEELEALRAAMTTPEPTAPDATRDPLTDPREGDWFVDDDGQVREVLGLEGHGITYRISDDKHPSYMSLAAFVENRRKWRARAMTPAEAAALVARYALAKALLGIEATTVEEYRDRAHALAMNWKLEE